MKERLVWIDWMKTFLILCVVLGHSGSVFSDFIYTFHIPAFFFISGYLYRYKKGSLFPFPLLGGIIVYNVFFIIINAFLIFFTNKGIMHASNEPKDLLYEVLIRPLMGIIWVNYNETTIPNPLCGQFWFVWVLIFIRILHSFTNKLSLKGKLLTSLLPIIIVYIECYFHIKTIFYVDRILIAYPFFALGSIMKQTNIWKRSKLCLVYKSYIIKILILVMAILLLGILYYINNKLFINKRFDMFYYELGKNVFWYYLINIINITCLIIIFNNFKQSKIVQDISSGTFLILGLHLFIILYICGKMWYFFIDPTRLTMLACTLLICIPLIQYSHKHFPILLGK